MFEAMWGSWSSTGVQESDSGYVLSHLQKSLSSVYLGEYSRLCWKFYRPLLSLTFIAHIQAVRHLRPSTYLWTILPAEKFSDEQLIIHLKSMIFRWFEKQKFFCISASTWPKPHGFGFTHTNTFRYMLTFTDAHRTTSWKWNKESTHFRTVQHKVGHWRESINCSGSDT